MSISATILNHSADFIVYTDKAKSLVLFGFSLFLVSIFIYMLYVLITDNESRVKLTKPQRIFTGLAVILSLLLGVKLNLENIAFFFQKEPELIINNEGIKFHSLGFLPWSEVDHIKRVRRRKGTNAFRVILKLDSQWQPEATSFFSSSEFSDNNILIKKSLDVDLNDLFNALNRINEPTKIHE